MGYVSPDFRRHSCAYVIEPLLRAHDRRVVEIFCYADVQKRDQMTERIRALSDHWYDALGKSHATVTEQIRRDRIDILVDLAGHTANNRLLVFAHRPAPIQITWLGYPDTTGLDAMDYRFTDEMADPEGIADNYASETLIRLPNGFLCYDPPADAPDIAEDPPALKTGQVTFGSFNNLTKVTEKVVALWSKILQEIPDSRVLLKNRQLTNESTRKRYLDLFSKNGIPENRVTLMPRTPSLKGHLSLYNEVDIGLDPFPYNGTITCFEALWMGVPIVTRCGDRHASRVASSILTRLGLTDLIAKNEEAYLATATRLARDIPRIKALRTSLRQRMQNSPLCDAQAFARTIESAYQDVWQKSQHPAPSAQSPKPMPQSSAPSPQTPESGSQRPDSRAQSLAPRAQPPLTPPIKDVGGRPHPPDKRCRGQASPIAPSALTEAVQHHKAGELDKAREIYARILETDPNHGDSLYYMGFIAYQTGRHDEAKSFIRKAIRVAPQNAVYHNTLGVVRKAQGDFDGAFESYEKSIALNPNYADAYYNMGNALNVSGRTEEAVAAYRKVLTINPKNAQAYNNMGAALKDLGKVDEAMDCYRKALEISPNYAEAYNNMGAALKHLERTEEALACYEKALKINPNNAEAHYNLGNVLKSQGKLAEAIACYERALTINPDSAEAYSNMGNALKDQGRLNEAVASCRKAVEIKPDNAEAHNSMGVALNDQGKIAEAAACYQKALSNKPDYPEAHNNIGNIMKEQGKVKEAIAYYKKALEIRPTYYQAHSNLLFTFQYGDSRIFGPEYSAKWVFEQHRVWNELHAKPLSGEIQPHENDPTPDRKLRVGYVSPDFHRHSCAYFIEPLFRGHDKSEVEVFCYAHLTAPDEVTEELKSLADQWRPTVGQTHAEIARQIRADRIDILVDLAGHSANDHLMIFARKPAPIQVTWLGYPDTTGMDVMDYRLTDAEADPEGSDPYFTETLIRLPGGFLCYEPLSETPDVSDLPALSTGEIVFVSFNNTTKVTENVLGVWSRILKQIPKAHLLIKSKQMADESTEARYFKIFSDNGISSDRVTILSRMSSRQGHLRLYNQVDIALDPFPYNGTTTSCEALWMGVPVITLRGERHVGRVGTSLLTRVGLTELIAESESDYIAKAVHLAGDLDRVRTLRAALRGRMQDSPLRNPKAFAQSVEHAYREMWARGERREASGEGRRVSGKGRRVSGKGREAIGNRRKGKGKGKGKGKDRRKQRKGASRKETEESQGDPSPLAACRLPLAACPSPLAPRPSPLAACRLPLAARRLPLAARRLPLAPRPLPEDIYREGNRLRDQGRTEEAIACYRQAVEMNPEYAEAWNSMGNMFRDQVKPREAMTCYRKALEINPNYVQACNNLGIVLEDQERIDEAILCYREAMRIDPNYGQAYSNLLPQMQLICDWQGYEALSGKLDELTEHALKAGKKALEDPFTSLTRHADPARNFAVARSWVTELFKPLAGLKMNFSFDARRKTAQSSDNRRITVGYLSKDFRNHPVAHLTLRLFGLHNRDEFAIFCYSYGQDDGSDYRRQIQTDCDQFVDIREMGYADAASRIYADQVDILIDLMGFTGGSRLGICALRPAPIQATYLGFPGTTAADFMDYIITDRIVTPESHAVYYSEKFVYMPHTFQLNDNTQVISESRSSNASPRSPIRDVEDKHLFPDKKRRGQVPGIETLSPTSFIGDRNDGLGDGGLPDGRFVFCSFNQAYKIEPVMFDLWMRILRQVPESVLWLAHANETVKRNLTREAGERGVSPERLIFAERLPAKADHLARHKLAALALDTRIYNGHTTTTDALWAGVPVITLQGTHYASRASASILTAMGLPELIAHTPEEYEALAMRLATHPDELQAIRRKIAENRTTSPLFDTPGFVRSLERAYEEMWRIFLEGEGPKFVVPPLGGVTPPKVPTTRMTYKKGTAMWNYRDGL